jgi:hypothetical protein
MTESRHYTRSIAVFAAREDATEIMESITACRLSSAHEQCDAICDVLVNGNRKLADDLVRILPSAQNDEPPRVYRRLQLLRGLEYEQSESIFPGG